MRVIAYYTVNTPYEQEIEEFKANLKKFNIEPIIYPVTPRGSWERNCAIKPEIIKQALADTSDNILYLDADARLKRQPPFHEIEKDIPGYSLVPKEAGPGFQTTWRRMNSATIYFPNNEISSEVIDLWIEKQKEQPTVWDQQILGKIFEQFPYFELPVQWAKIDRILYWVENEIVYQTQASRRLKKVVRGIL